MHFGHYLVRNFYLFLNLIMFKQNIILLRMIIKNSILQISKLINASYQTPQWVACVLQVSKGHSHGLFGLLLPTLKPHPSPATKRVWPITKKIKKSENKKKKRKKHAGHALLKATAVVDLTHHLLYTHTSLLTVFQPKYTHILLQ